MIAVKSAYGLAFPVSVEMSGSWRAGHIAAMICGSPSDSPGNDEIINVAYGETGHYVSLSLPDSVKDTKLLDPVAKRLDVELATGKYDSLFGR